MVTRQSMLFQLVWGATPANSAGPKTHCAVPPGLSPKKLKPTAPIDAAKLAPGSRSNAARRAGFLILFIVGW